VYNEIKIDAAACRNTRAIYPGAIMTRTEAVHVMDLGDDP